MRYIISDFMTLCAWLISGSAGLPRIIPHLLGRPNRRAPARDQARYTRDEYFNCNPIF